MTLKDLQQARYFNKLYFRLAILFSILVFISCLILTGFDLGQHAYYKCNPAEYGPPQCENPFYSCWHDYDRAAFRYDCELFNAFNCEGDLCKSSLLQKGEEVGQRPPQIVNAAGLLIFVLVGLAFLINHFQYKRGKHGTKINSKKR